MTDQMRLLELLVDRYQPFRDLIINGCEHGSKPASNCSQPSCEQREMLRLLNSAMQRRQPPVSLTQTQRIPALDRWQLPKMTTPTASVRATPERRAHWLGSTKIKVTLAEVEQLDGKKFTEANLLVWLYRKGIPMKLDPSRMDYRWWPSNEDMIDLIDLPAWRVYTAEPLILTFEYYTHAR
jgi:hypothetical protein